MKTTLTVALLSCVFTIAMADGDVTAAPDAPPMVAAESMRACQVGFDAAARHECVRQGLQRSEPADDAPSAQARAEVPASVWVAAVELPRLGRH